MYYKVKVREYLTLQYSSRSPQNATSAIANVDDYSGSAQLLAATTLRNVLGTRNLGDILADRQGLIF